MRDSFQPEVRRPFGYFVHHQGRGHAERCAMIVNALPEARPVTIFCARPDIFPPLRDGVTIVRIPSLFEATGAEVTGFDRVETPDTLHCAPLGWPGIRQAMATIAGWFADADPGLMICDVSAEIAQLCRICSVPHVMVLQHGDRGDPGHMAAYDGAIGLLAPFSAALAQPSWTRSMRAKTHFAGGIGAGSTDLERSEARADLDLAADERIALVISGGGGSGIGLASLGVAARTFPDWRWVVIGSVQEDWHATIGANLDLRGWVDCPERYLSATDLVVSSAGNTTCGQVLASRRPWIVVPEWRYFDEQIEKARALDRAGVAHVLPHLPSSAGAWRSAVECALESHEPDRQAALLDAEPALSAANWLDSLIAPSDQGPVETGVMNYSFRSTHP